MRILTVKIENQIISIQNNYFPSNTITIGKYDEKKYPQGYQYQAYDYLLKKDELIVSMGWDELNNCNIIISKSENLLK
jgi:hypothetical protein